MPYDRAALARRARAAQGRGGTGADNIGGPTTVDARQEDERYVPRGQPHYREGDIERPDWDAWLEGLEWRGADGQRDAQHITIIGKNRDGKSHLANQLERWADKPKVVVFAAKPPGDPALEVLKRQGYRHVTRWPWHRTAGVRTGPRLKEGERVRLLLWPKITTASDLPRVKGLYTEALDDIFAAPWIDHTGSGWVERVDEGRYSTHPSFLGLGHRLEDHWQRIAGNDSSLVFLTQRASNVPMMAYDQVGHLFASRCNDRRDADRVGEMMGEDRLMVRDALASLGRFEFLHMDHDAGSLAIVTAPPPRQTARRGGR